MLVCAVPVNAEYPLTPSNCLFTLTLSFMSSTFRTNNLSVPIPKTSFGAIAFRDRSPVTDIFVTYPVSPVVPIPVFRIKNDVLNPIRCLPSSLLNESVESPDIVTTSPTTKSCG